MMDNVSDFAQVVSMVAQITVLLMTLATRKRFRSQFAWLLVLMFPIGALASSVLGLGGLHGDALRAAAWCFLTIGIAIHVHTQGKEARR